MPDQDVTVQSRDPWGPWGPATRLVVAATATIVGLWLLLTLRGIVLQILLAIILATGLAPLVNRLQRLGVPRAVSVLLTYALFIAALVVFGIVVIPPLVGQIQDLVANAPQYADRVTGWLGDLQRRFPFLPPLDEQLAEQFRNLGGQLGAIAGRILELGGFVLGALSGLFAVVLVLLIALYLIMYGAQIRQYFLSFLDPARRPRVRSVTDRMGQRMGQWVLGQLALSAVVGVVTFIGLTIIGVPGAVLLAVIAAIGEVIPIVGPILSAIPAIIVALIESPVQGIITLVFYVVLQQLESYVLAPNIVGRAVKLNPLAVLLALLIGGTLLGIVGALVAVPVAAALAVVLDEGRQEDAPATPESSSQDEQPP